MEERRKSNRIDKEKFIISIVGAAKADFKAFLRNKQIIIIDP